MAFSELLAEVSRIDQLTHNVRSYEFSFGGQNFSYLAGQHIQLFLPIDREKCDNRCNVRAYSIASSPTETERSNKIMIATKFADVNPSVFKQYLGNIRVGSKLKIRGPIGKFTLPTDYSREIVMIAGGIGITPFRSMIKFATDNKLPFKITLLYSNKTRNDIIWDGEFKQIASQNSSFRIINTVTDEDNLDTWDGEKGLISESMILKYTQVQDSIFYLCGPPLMVKSLTETLLKLGVNQDYIRSELFTGY